MLSIALRKEWVACGLSGIFVLARNIIDSLLNIKCDSRGTAAAMAYIKTTPTLPVCIFVNIDIVPSAVPKSIIRIVKIFFYTRLWVYLPTCIFSPRTKVPTCVLRICCVSFYEE